MNFEQVLERFEIASRTSSDAMARCPAHEDRQASLHITEKKNGDTLVKCHARCDTAAVLARVGLEFSDLFREPSRRGRDPGLGPFDEIISTYGYTDEKGSPLFQVVRGRIGGKAKEFRQRHPCTGRTCPQHSSAKPRAGWCWKVEGVRRVVYHLPQVLEAARAGSRIFVVEGEKDADRLAGAGVVATSAAGGAGKWRREFAAFFRGAREVVAIADKDAPGRKHAADVADSIHRAGGRARVLELPGERVKDVSDWLDAGGTIGELEQLADAAPVWPAQASSSAAAPPAPAPATAPRLLEGLAQRALTDPGAPFEPAVLDALAQLDVAAWQRLRKDLKAAGVRMVDLDEARRERQRAGGEGQAEREDELVRSVVSNGTGVGWYVRTRVGWIAHKTAEARAKVAAHSADADEVAAVLGRAVENPWELVNLPFKPEYPAAGRRIWNRDAAQLAYRPAPGPCPTWTRVLDHCGRGLDHAAARDAWCQASGAKSGGDYLRLWLAALLQEPLEPLPFLFFHGPQNTGKSTFHEAAGLLLTRGYVPADQSLTSQGGFNGELAGAVLCVVEETDLRQERNALNRIKDWVTSRTISIHAKGRTPYPQANATHWVQTANSITHCPILRGDTRITVISVAPLEEEEVPKRVLLEQLRREAPAFLHASLTVRLPDCPGRLRIPVVETNEKLEHMRSNRNELERFLDERPDWFALSPEEIAVRFLPTVGHRATAWPPHRIEQELLNAEADVNRFGAPRRLARALRRWFEAGGRRPRYELTGEVLKQLEGPCASWDPRRAGKHAAAIVPALRLVGITFSMRDVRAGREWRFEPCRVDDGLHGLRVSRGGDVA